MGEEVPRGYSNWGVMFKMQDNDVGSDRMKRATVEAEIALMSGWGAPAPDFSLSVSITPTSSSPKHWVILLFFHSFSFLCGRLREVAGDTSASCRNLIGLAEERLLEIG